MMPIKICKDVYSFFQLSDVCVFLHMFTIIKTAKWKQEKSIGMANKQIYVHENVDLSENRY
jgi:hypothetical protein